MAVSPFDTKRARDKQQIDDALDRHLDTLRDYEKKTAAGQSCRGYASSHPEPALLAYATNYLQEHGITSVRDEDSKVMFMAIAVVNLFAAAVASVNMGNASGF